MKHGLVAPQFGLGSLFEASGPQPGSLPSAGPTVVVKRRRWLKLSDEAAAPAEAEGDHERAPKVYRLESARPSGGEPGPAGAPSGPEIEPEHPGPLRRRRRDPSMRPQLIRHDVFDVEPAAAAMPDAEPLPPLAGDADAGYDLACRMLEEVRHDLALARSAKRFVESFRVPAETS